MSDLWHDKNKHLIDEGHPIQYNLSEDIICLKEEVERLREGLIHLEQLHHNQKATVREARQRVQELETGVKTIYNTMGPETPDCCGCKAEWSVSMEICKSLLEAKSDE